MSDEMLGGYLSAATVCRLLAYGPADATTIPKPHHLLPHLESRLVLPRMSRNRGC